MEGEARVVRWEGGGEPGWVGEGAGGEREGVRIMSSLLIHGSLVPGSQLLHTQGPVWPILPRKRV